MIVIITYIVVIIQKKHNWIINDNYDIMIIAQ